MDYVEDQLSRELIAPKKRHRERLAQELYMAQLLEKAQESSAALLAFYEDVSGTRKEAATALDCTSLELLEFYVELRKIREHYRGYTASNVSMTAFLELTVQPIERILGLSPAIPSDLECKFSGDEAYGKYLDLNSSYSLYCNLKGAPSRDYLSFIAMLDNFESIPGLTKASVDYEAYLDHVNEYLRDYLKRAKPLINIEAAISGDRGPSSVAQRPCEEDVLFCKACKKRFAKMTVFQAHLTGKKHLKALESASATETVGPGRVQQLERAIWIMMQSLKDVRDNTIANIERKQGRLAGELDQDDEEDWDDEQVLGSLDENGDHEDGGGLKDAPEDRLYNPLKLPLGWDGKPIPYWLYKLHGLSQTFTCEICGNYSYQGRKAFDKHFQVTHGVLLTLCLSMNL